MTPEQAEARERLVALACMVALKAPPVRNQYVHEARVPWVLIEEIRDTMAKAGLRANAPPRKDKRKGKREVKPCE